MYVTEGVSVADEVIRRSSCCESIADGSWGAPVRVGCRFAQKPNLNRLGFLFVERNPEIEVFRSNLKGRKIYSPFPYRQFSLYDNSPEVEFSIMKLS